MYSRTPTDLWVAKVGQLFAFYLGRLEDMTEIGRLVVKAYSDNHYAHGMLAFALEEVKDALTQQLHNSPSTTNHTDNDNYNYIGNDNDNDNYNSELTPG